MNNWNISDSQQIRIANLTWEICVLCGSRSRSVENRFKEDCRGDCRGEAQKPSGCCSLPGLHSLLVQSARPHFAKVKTAFAPPTELSSPMPPPSEIEIFSLSRIELDIANALPESKFPYPAEKENV